MGHEFDHASDAGHLETIIIGAGVGGVFVSKELHQCGSANFLCFDAMPRPGGVYVRYSYPGMRFTTSTNTAAFGDFPWRVRHSNFC
jgi:cation diffusion facilitator CzcD-associated flavoprotein CzcO